MTLDQLSLARGPVDGREPAGEGSPSAGDDSIKTARLPRWTRQEILVLIQGKRVAENRVKRGRVSGFGFGSGQTEPKWASVASYCKRHGVNRGPVQCRKRWSNLAGDYKKIKEWESKTREETESFWLMRNDLRRERKLPGFFDKEVFDILDGGGADAGGEEEEVGGELSLALASVSAVGGAIEGVIEVETLFDSGRSAVAEEGLFSDVEPPGKMDPSPSLILVGDTGTRTLPAPTPISVTEKQYQSFPQESSGQGIAYEKQAASDAEDRGIRKRKRFAVDGDEEVASFQQQLIESLDKNSELLGLQFEAQNTHLRLDREQRKEHAKNLATVLNKLVDALGRIADKL